MVNVLGWQIPAKQSQSSRGLPAAILSCCQMIYENLRRWICSLRRAHSQAFVLRVLGEAKLLRCQPPQGAMAEAVEVVDTTLV
mmetsp:Transcript_58902/g.137848  ORF Transcript_58902/g.137848 Transcript_58902/m.137848 type:complete len:83 (-) Transcript_58902:49-297(-)